MGSIKNLMPHPIVGCIGCNAFLTHLLLLICSLAGTSPQCWFASLVMIDSHLDLLSWLTWSLLNAVGASSHTVLDRAVGFLTSMLVGRLTHNCDWTVFVNTHPVLQSRKFCKTHETAQMDFVKSITLDCSHISHHWST